MLTLFSSNTRNTNDANLLGSPCGKNCLYILMKPYKERWRKRKKKYGNMNQLVIRHVLQQQTTAINPDMRECCKTCSRYVLALLVSHSGSLLKIPYTLKIEKLN